MTARALNLLGVDLGREDVLIGTGPANPKGYWERRDILEINDAVLRTVGGGLAGSQQRRAGSVRSAELSALQDRAATLIDDCFGQSSLWGFKSVLSAYDARTYLLLPFWRTVVPELRYVICVRDPAEVSASLGRYPRFEVPDAAVWEKLWVGALAKILVETRGAHRIVVSYDDYFSDLRHQIERFASFIGRPPTPFAVAGIEAFIERSLRHHWMTGDVAGENPGLPAARRLYAVIRNARADEELRAAETVARNLLRLSFKRRLASRWTTMQHVARAPSVIQRFPRDLVGPGTRAFGIYADGWLDQAAFVAFPGGGPADLVLEAEVLDGPAQAVEIVVNGRWAASVHVPPGAVEVRVPIPSSRRRRHVELRWASTMPLRPPDTRSVAALLRRFAVVAPGASVP